MTAGDWEETGSMLKFLPDAPPQPAARTVAAGAGAGAAPGYGTRIPISRR